MTDQDRFNKREKTMQKLRWLTPGMLLLLTTAIGLAGWVCVDYLTQIRTALVDLKEDGNAHYDKLWAAIKASNARVDCIQNQLAKCCKDSSYCA